MKCELRCWLTDDQLHSIHYTARCSRPSRTKVSLPKAHVSVSRSTVCVRHMVAQLLKIRVLPCRCFLFCDSQPVSYPSNDSESTWCSMYGPCTVLDGKNIVVAGHAASASCWWVQGRDRSWQQDRYLIVQCPEGFNHHSMNGAMSVLKPHKHLLSEKEGRVMLLKS